MNLESWQRYIVNSISNYLGKHSQPYLSSIYVPNFLHNPQYFMQIFAQLFAQKQLHSKRNAILVITSVIYHLQFKEQLADVIDARELLANGKSFPNLDQATTVILVDYEILEILIEQLNLHRISLKLCLAFEPSLYKRVKYVCHEEKQILDLGKKIQIDNLFFISSFPIQINNKKRIHARESSNSPYFGKPVAILGYQKLVELYNLKLPSLIFSGVSSKLIYSLLNRIKVAKPNLNFYDGAMITAIIQALLLVYRERDQSTNINVLCLCSKERLYQETNFTNDFRLELISFLTPKVLLENIYDILDILIEIIKDEQLIATKSIELQNFKQDLNLVEFDPESVSVEELQVKQNIFSLNLFVPHNNPVDKTISNYQRTQSMITRAKIKLNVVLFPVDIHGTFSITIALNTLLGNPQQLNKKLIMPVVIPEDLDFTTACDQYSATTIISQLVKILKLKFCTIENGSDGLFAICTNNNLFDLHGQGSLFIEAQNEDFELLHKD